MPARRPPSGSARPRGAAGTKPAAARRTRANRVEPADLAALAGRGETPPIILMTGRDLFTREAVLAGLKSALVAEGLEAFNYAVLSGEEVSGADLAGRARMLPMGGGGRLLLVRRAEKVRAADAEPLAAYAGDPSPTTFLVMVFDAGRAPALEALRPVGVQVDLPAPRDYQLARWLEGQARGLRLRLDPDAARAIAERCGEDFVAAMSELQVAALAAKGPVTRAAVEALAGPARDTNAFHLSDALLSREPARAVKLLRDLDGAGTSGIVLLGMIEGHLRRLMRMRARMDAGMPAQAAVRAESPTLPPAALARTAGQVASFDQERLMAAFRLAREADRAVKGHGSGSEAAHLERLAWRIASL